MDRASPRDCDLRENRRSDAKAVLTDRLSAVAGALGTAGVRCLSRNAEVRFHVRSGVANTTEKQLNYGLEIPPRSLVSRRIVDPWPLVVPSRHAGVIELVDAPDSKRGSAMKRSFYATKNNLVKNKKLYSGILVRFFPIFLLGAT
jgi:hypothetical protein